MLWELLRPTAAGELRVFHGGQAETSAAQLWGSDQAVPDLTPAAERESPLGKAGGGEGEGEGLIPLLPTPSASTPHFIDL